MIAPLPLSLEKSDSLFKSKRMLPEKHNIPFFDTFSLYFQRISILQNYISCQDLLLRNDFPYQLVSSL